MGIEVRESSGWTTYYDPEVYTASGWQNILFGEVYTGVGPNNGWEYFYVRINVVDPVITLNSKTQTSITVNVTHSNPDSDLVRVFVYRVGNQAGGQYLPNSSGTTGTVSGTFTQSGLALGTSYTFRAYAEYLDGGGNVMVTSNVAEFTVATNTYNLYTPSIPTGSRGYSGSGSTYTATTSFTSSSNPLFSQNGSASYIQFEMQEYPVGSITPNIYTLNSTNLSNSDSLQSKTVTFTNLGLGSQCLCRARTVYTTIGEVSDWSEYSSVITNYNWTPVIVPGTWTHMQNSSYFSSFSSGGSSTKSGSSTSYASDGDTGTVWFSDPYTTANVTTQQSRTITTSTYAFGVIQHDVSGSHNIANPSTSGSTSINSLTFSPAGKCFTDANYIYFEVSDQYSIIRGNATIFNSTIANVNGVTRSILITQPVTGGVRQVLFSKPSNVPANQISSGSPTMVLPSSSSINSVSVSALGGSGTLYYVDSNTFYRFESSNPGSMPITTTQGTVTYDVTTQQQVPKAQGYENVTLFAVPNNFGSTPYRNVKLNNIYYRHGSIASSSVFINVNGITVSSGSRSANAVSTTSVSSLNISPNRTSSNSTGGSGWYVNTSVYTGLSGSLYYATVSEVQFKYEYESLQ
jgi:hypothetical protein